MTILFTLWCVLESSILPDCHKWVLLSHFINPLLLLGCQLYLFGQFVLLRLTFCISFPLRALWHANLWLCSSTRRCIFHLVMLSGLDDDSIIRQYGARDVPDKWMLDFYVDDPLSAMVLSGSCLVREFSASSVPTAQATENLKVVPVHNYYVEEVDEESENEFFSESEEEDEGVALSNGKEGGHEKKEKKGDEQQDGGLDMQNYLKEKVKIEGKVISHIDHTQQQKRPGHDHEKVQEQERISNHHQRQDKPHHRQQQPILVFNGMGAEETERTTVQIDGDKETETTSVLAENKAPEVAAEADSGPTNDNEFHMDYTGKMKALDQLCQERLHALSRVLNIHVEDQTFVYNIQLHIKSLDCLASSSYMFCPPAIDNKHLLRKIISELELVYVGQSCLSWEALQHQYHTVDTYASSVPGAVFDEAVVEKFRLFSTLLERFIESYRIVGQWVWNYIRERCVWGKLLQVPEIPGYTEVNGGHNEESKSSEQLLMIVNNSIKIFYDFIVVNNKSLLNFKELFKLDSQVDNPNDIQLFDHLSKEVSKKKRRLKKIAIGRRCWWRKRSEPFRDTESRVILFSLIDLELASRVLKMFVISTNQLQWCEERLNSIQLYEGRVIRNPARSSFPLM